jgi:hypothetical protein
MLIANPANPFALLMNPDTVVLAMERSDRLSRLQRRICRPLDKPLIPRVGKDVAAFDREIDAAVEVEPADEIEV